MTHPFGETPAAQQSNPYGTPPPASSHKHVNWKGFAILASLMLLVTTAVVTWSVVGPKVLDKFDTGVQACRYMAEDKAPNGTSRTDGTESSDESQTWTHEEYKAIRKIFQDSRHDDIRQAGTRFTDDANAMNLVSIFGSYSDLSTACANHGYPLPPLG